MSVRIISFWDQNSRGYQLKPFTYRFTDSDWNAAQAGWKNVKVVNASITFQEVAYWYALKHLKPLTNTNATGTAYTVDTSKVRKFDDTVSARIEFGSNKIAQPPSAKPPTTGASAVTANVSRAEMKNNCKWNLPPHMWSLPYRDSDTYGKSSGSARRGKIFYYTFNPQDQSPTVMSQDPNDPSKTVMTSGTYTTGDARKYGFQFMWNPETYSTNTSLQPDITPSKDDIWVSGAGMFPGVETVSFTIRLDRTNDFACFRKYYPNGKTTLREDEKVELIKKYYPEKIPNESNHAVDVVGAKKISKLDWLMKYGTLADLEYLYRVFTDINVVNKPLGDNFVTADVGFIGFFIVCIEVGPVYYLGYITGVNVNHLAFTEDYIPIRTDVTISVNIMANGSDVVGMSGGSVTNTSQSNTNNGGSSIGNLVLGAVNNVATFLKNLVEFKDWTGNPSWGGVDPRS